MSTMTSDSGSQATSNSMPESERKYFQVRSMYSSALLFHASTRQFLRGQGAYIHMCAYVHNASGLAVYPNMYTVHMYGT